jgi:hypothetical protein
MAENKYSFGQQSLMKALEPGQKATFTFVNKPKVVETEWGEKYQVPILLLTHPHYSNLSSKGTKMTWQSNAKVMKDIVDLMKESAEFMKDYYDFSWELSVAEDGSYWLNSHGKA